MNVKGFSGASVTVLDNTVLKVGPGAIAQARLCRSYPLWLVCPRITAISVSTVDGYAMERLSELDDACRGARAPLVVREVMAALRENVWRVSREWSSAWYEPLASRLRDTLDIDARDAIESMWQSQTVGQAIHGDPTLSNAMRRRRQLVLIDPIASPYIPNHATVDVGKLLQSAIGWERTLLGWTYDRRACVRAALASLGPVARRRSWFWCMVHCARIIPYARKAGRQDVELWAYSCAISLWKMLTEPLEQLKSEDVCDMLLI